MSRHLVRELELGDLVEQLVADVQQELHDTFVDTSWPECPRHGKHPLWYRDGAWYCDHIEEPVARPGELAPSRH